ncbi:ribulose-phosphate 3-epimerase [Candidatus Woesearchaeota archaeon]|nr:ribulose-phosphate 3-epimerase [Candidatus Woesearchaeota archaeon]|tara:strand:- start:24235 stop:24876 length:642 start_codon:yes stop_codon:yes gene_type:complete
MVKIAPSILSADFSKLAEEIKKVEKHVDMIHIDIMDGHFVPNITFGPPVVSTIRKITKLTLDAHLMIEKPDKFIEEFAEAGADIMSVHVEAVEDLDSTIRKIKDNNVKAAVVLNPATPLSRIENVLEEVDMVLLMTVNPGFGGQKFIESVLPKIRELREIIDNKKLKIQIEVDGGINAETAKLATSAGADILVAGSFIYDNKNPLEAIKLLKT